MCSGRTWTAISVASRQIEYGARHKRTGVVHGPHQDMGTVRTALLSLNVDDSHELVTRFCSSWVTDEDKGQLEMVLPVTECTHCKGTRLGFDVSYSSSANRVEFYQGCNDCSETLWVADWELFVAVLAFIYDIRIPTLD